MIKFKEGDVIFFKTSKGIITGTLKKAYGWDSSRGSFEIGDWFNVDIDDTNRKILSKMYLFSGISLDKNGWVSIGLDDGYYGCPEYEAFKIEEK